MKLTKFQFWGIILVVKQDVISLFLWLSVNWLNRLPPTRPNNSSQFRNYVSFSIIHLISQITCDVSTTMDIKSVILWLLRNCSISSKFSKVIVSISVMGYSDIGGILMLVTTWCLWHCDINDIAMVVASIRFGTTAVLSPNIISDIISAAYIYIATNMIRKAKSSLPLMINILH